MSSPFALTNAPPLFPGFTAESRFQIQQGPNINLFKSNDEQRMIAAWLFAKFMLEPERTAEFSIPSGYAPIRYSAYETTRWTNYVAGIKENPTTTSEAIAKLVKEAIENHDIYKDKKYVNYKEEIDEFIEE